MWQQTVARLSGRAVVVPEAEELVALGAAAQAAAVLTGEPADEIARRWDTRRARTVEPPASPDVETLARIRGCGGGARVARSGQLQQQGPGRYWA